MAKKRKGKGTRRPKPEEEDWGGPRRWRGRVMRKSATGGRVARKSAKADRVSALEVIYMARKYGVSAEAIRKVIRRVGRSRRRVEKVLESESKTR